MSAELAARRIAAAAVLGDYKAELASAPLANPPGREWMLRLASVLEDLLAALDNQADDEDQADKDQADKDQADKDQADDEDDFEPYCSTCGATVGIFIGHGDAWLHYTGEGTVANPVELFDAGHAPEVARRPAGPR